MPLPDTGFDPRLAKTPAVRAKAKHAALGKRRQQTRQSFVKQRAGLPADTGAEAPAAAPAPLFQQRQRGLAATQARSAAASLASGLTGDAPSVRGNITAFAQGARNRALTGARQQTVQHFAIRSQMERDAASARQSEQDMFLKWARLGIDAERLGGDRATAQKRLELEEEALRVRGEEGAARGEAREAEFGLRERGVELGEQAQEFRETEAGKRTEAGTREEAAEGESEKQRRYELAIKQGASREQATEFAETGRFSEDLPQEPRKRQAAPSKRPFSLKKSAEDAGVDTEGWVEGEDVSQDFSLFMDTADDIAEENPGMSNEEIAAEAAQRLGLVGGAAAGGQEKQFAGSKRLEGRRENAFQAQIDEQAQAAGGAGAAPEEQPPSTRTQGQQPPAGKQDKARTIEDLNEAVRGVANSDEAARIIQRQFPGTRVEPQMGGSYLIYLEDGTALEWDGEAS